MINPSIYKDETPEGDENSDSFVSIEEVFMNL